VRDDGFKDFVLDQLRDLDGLSCRRMFGGHGLYQDEVFFGIVHRGHLYFKTDSTSLPAYLEMGMKSFRPSVRQTLRSYYEVPADVTEDQEQLTAWARRAVQCQKPEGGRWEVCE
jgi:DNA transformation protein